MLEELLPIGHIQHIESVSDWKEAIVAASQPLLNEKRIEQSYVDSMIKSVEINGPYIVLADYFALPHAAAGDGVNQLSMSLLVLDDPADLKGNPVTIFLVLAAIDNESHLEALAEISELLADEEAFKTFLKGNRKAILELIKNEE